MPNIGAGEFIIYTLISIISLFSLLLFVPHTLLSSSDDTPLIFYRYLMILAGLLLFLYNIIINFNGISDELSYDIKTLCKFIDWIYILIVIPLVIPFINNIIKAAQTTSQISMFKFSANKLSLVPTNSDKDHRKKNKDEKSNKYSKLIIILLTFLTWLSAIVCQVLSWYNNDPFYEKILFQYIISSYICYTCLFVAVSFISLYREINKVQKSFIKVQTQFKKQTNSSLSVNQKHKNDNSASIYDETIQGIEAMINKNAEANQEIIQNLGKHKNKCTKITTFVMILLASDMYSTFSLMKREQSMLNIAYSDHPLFTKPYNYILFMLTRLVFTSIMYLWLAINNLYKKPPPQDSIAYLIYSHCFCQFKCCQCIHLLCNHENKNSKQQEIELCDIPKITEFKDDINYNKKQNNINEPRENSNATLPNSNPNVNMQATSDEYADIDNITMFNTPEMNEQKENKLPKMAIHIIQSSKENNFDNNFNDSNKSSMNDTETGTKSKYLHKYHNSATTLVSIGNEEFSALPTYKEEFHRDNGLMENDANIFANYVNSIGSFEGDSEVFSPSPNSFHFPNILRKTTDTIVSNIPNLKLPSTRPNSNTIHQIESDSDDMDNKMIVGIKVIVYALDVVLFGNLEKICTSILDKYETRIKRLLQHFLIMNDNISNVFIISNKMKTDSILERLELIHLKNSFIGNKEKEMYNVIGYDHKWINDCNKNVKLMLLGLLKNLKIENDELLFVANKKLMQYIETANICQVYDVDAIEMDKNNETEHTDGTLQGRHLMYLESQVLASI